MQYEYGHKPVENQHLIGFDKGPGAFFSSSSKAPQKLKDHPAVFPLLIPQP